MGDQVEDADDYSSDSDMFDVDLDQATPGHDLLASSQHVVWDADPGISRADAPVAPATPPAESSAAPPAPSDGSPPAPAAAHDPAADDSASAMDRDPSASAAVEGDGVAAAAGDASDDEYESDFEAA